MIKELNLYFDEKEVIRILEFNQALLLNRIRKSLKRHLLILLTWMFVGLVMLIVGIEYFYPALIVFGFAFTIVSIFLLLIAPIKYQKRRKKLKELLVYPKDFIERYNNLETVKYLFDDYDIKYIEEEHEQFSMSWQQLIDIKRDENSIYLIFNEQGNNIWIPKKMTLKDELLEFENLLNKLKTTANNGSCCTTTK